MKTKLYDLISANTGLRYIDPLTGKIFSTADFHMSFSVPEGRGLAFLYLDNSVASIEVLLHFLRSDWALCLLNPRLDEVGKSALEEAYRPGYIYDPVRNLATAYDTIAYPIAPDIKLLLSTSGSTGSPKMVKLSEENIVSNALSILDYLPVQSTDTAPLNLPLFYSYGFSVFTTNAIAGGKLLCTCRDIIQKEFWEDWQQYRCSSLAGVPYVYEMVHRLGLLGKMQPSLRYLSQAGGKLSPQLTEQFISYSKEYNFPFYIMYGQTEATARMSWLDPVSLEHKAGSIGKPVRGGSFTIDAGSGELLYAGPNVFGGYAESFHDLAHYCQPEVLVTGDIAERDEDGFYYIRGRIKRFVKLFGLRINLDDVERLLQQQFPENHWLCIGNNDQLLQIMYTGNPSPDIEVRRWISDRLKVHPGSVRLQQLPHVPLNSNGKVDYAQAAMLVQA